MFLLMSMYNFRINQHFTWLSAVFRGGKLVFIMSALGISVAQIHTFSVDKIVIQQLNNFTNSVTKTPGASGWCKKVYSADWSTMKVVFIEAKVQIRRAAGLEGRWFDPHLFKPGVCCISYSSNAAIMYKKKDVSDQSQNNG